MSPHPSKRRLICASLAALTIVAGLVWRLALLGLPPFLFKYGGSALWAMMVYWLIAAMFPRLPPFKLAVAACVIAALVELSRLHHSPAEEAFRRTLAGRLLLGRIFSTWDIAAYWIAIALAGVLDLIATRRNPASPRPRTNASS